MHRGIKVLCLLSIIVGLSLASSTARADHPAYLLLKTPADKGHHHPTHGYSPGYGYGVQTHAYAYGWFGAKPKTHWTRHLGYERNYTQWSSR